MLNTGYQIILKTKLNIKNRLLIDLPSLESGSEQLHSITNINSIINVINWKGYSQEQAGAIPESTDKTQEKAVQIPMIPTPATLPPL